MFCSYFLLPCYNTRSRDPVRVRVCVCGGGGGMRSCVHMRMAVSPRMPDQPFHFGGYYWMNTLSTALKGGDLAERLAPGGPAQRGAGSDQRENQAVGGVALSSITSGVTPKTLVAWALQRGPQLRGVCQASTLSSCREYQGMGTALTFSRSTKTGVQSSLPISGTAAPILRKLESPLLLPPGSLFFLPAWGPAGSRPTLRGSSLAHMHVVLGPNYFVPHHPGSSL